jgi:preprotein translocase subunit YajC
MKQHQAMIQAVKKNDVVVTGGGLIGKATKVDENEVEVEIAPNVRVRVLKSTLSDVRPHGAKPAND